VRRWLDNMDKTALWEVATSPPSSAENVASVLKLAGKRMCSLCTWRWCYGWGCDGQGVENGAPTVGLVQHVGWFDPVGRHGDGLAAHKKLQCFLSPREHAVRAAVRGLQSPACCVLTEKDMHAVMEVLVHESG
jgi:hypothetical protein